MELKFRIDWGYQRLYSRRHYHPVYRWDGNLECRNGKIVNTALLEYPYMWFGPGHSPVLKPLPEPRWESITRRALAGVAVTAEADTESTEFTLNTMSGVFHFSAAELQQNGRLVFPVGAGESLCTVIVTLDHYYWFRPAPASDKQQWLPDDLELPREDWSRMWQATLVAGAEVQLAITLAPPQPLPAQDHEVRLQLYLQAMGSGLERLPDGHETQAYDNYDLDIITDRSTTAIRHYFRAHDISMQMLEDVWALLPVGEVPQQVTLRNRHPELPLRISRITARWQVRRHLELSLPAWALAGEPLIGRIYAVRPDTVTVKVPGAEIALALVPGWNEFDFTLTEPGRKIPVSVNDETAYVDAVYAVKEEAVPVKLGYDMTTVPHDDNGLMDYILDYTWRTRLGNFVAFRAIYQLGINDEAVTPAMVQRWSDFCRRHRIYMQWNNAYRAPFPVTAGGEYLHNAGPHEYSGSVYAHNPDGKSIDMADAARRFVADLKTRSDEVHAVGAPSGLGDASGGCRYALEAGFDFIRTETMVGPTTHLCSLARAAAGAGGKAEWGVHIAIQHAKQPYLENHFGEYFLGLYQPWIMGAQTIYEEDSLFLLFKEERQGWDDLLTKGKRDMTREFFRFIKTHPRSGAPAIRIATVEGRYAAPFNGFICDTEQDPHYSVWGKFGRNEPEWGHAQPEKVRQLLDVLMPGQATLPLRQRFDRRRFFYSGSPYGDFDQTPIEAGGDWLRQYRLLIHLGWNTMEAADHAKLCDYVKAGGTLFIGVAQFSTRKDRGFLRDGELKLWNDGDLSDLAGIRVSGPGKPYSGQWHSKYPGFDTVPELSRLPSDDPDEDGPCRAAQIELAGAEVVAYDRENGAPLMVRYRLGAGEVWTLTTWCYAGHEQLSELAAAYLAGLCRQHRGEYHVEDPSGMTFWNFRPHPELEGYGTFMLLNTDWNQPGNRREVRLVTPHGTYPVTVTEREASILTVTPEGIFDPGPNGPHLEAVAPRHLKIHGTFPCRLRHDRGDRESFVSFPASDTTVQDFFY